MDARVASRGQTEFLHHVIHGTPVGLHEGELKAAGWDHVLAALGVSPAKAQHIVRLARENGTGFAAELVASGRIDEARLYATLAHLAGLRTMREIDPDRVMMRAPHRMAALGIHGGWPAVMYLATHGRTVLLIAPRNPDPRALARLVAERPDLAARIVVVAPSLLRQALLARSRDDLKQQASYGLFDRFPHYSARQVATAWQGALVGMAAAALPLIVIQQSSAATIGVHVFLSVFFLCCVILRVCSLNAASPPDLAQIEPVRSADLPVYTVCVALYHETRVVPQLLLALGRLQWPRSKLQIKLICEADDHETLAALRAHQLHPSIEIVEVPPGGPRTKPKALAFALPLCGGELLALYDAEDRPHPLQLIEAWQSFRRGGEKLACVQAPLWITNGASGIVARMFAFEYSGLFRGMLPWLSQAGLMFPLGGTSNHFRVSALRDVGGWDPYNVTEDADLGLRLHRLGYTSRTITHPTLEDAPETLAEWLPQRARWFKGWMQTWLVHMRHPVLLARDLGAWSFLVSQVLFLGLLVSALVHPVFLATVLVVGGRMVAGGAVAPAETTLFAIDTVNIAMGYAAFIALGAMTLMRSERQGLWKVVAFTPLYWLMLSWAAWWSVLEIILRPHHWNKTAHNVARNSPLARAIATPGPVKPSPTPAPAPTPTPASVRGASARASIRR